MITENEQKFIKQVISDFDNTPNKKITEVLDILRRDFDDSKNMKITETVYNELLVKYKNRTNS
jgi:hypothetical protein